MNLLGSSRCLPDCGPGFRVAADGANCEGDRGTGWGCPGFSRRGTVSLGRWAFRENSTLLTRGASRPEREPKLGLRGLRWAWPGCWHLKNL